MEQLRQDAEFIIHSAIQDCLPDRAVQRALEGRELSGRVRLVAVGKAAWQMAAAAERQLGERIEAGVVVTKYGHSRGPIRSFQILEAGHPIPDQNSIRGAEAAMELVRGLSSGDTVLFLVSGGGSALFEKPLIPLEELSGITQQLLDRGAEIGEINLLRKRLSAVKGGRFAQLCAPARVLGILLSDVLEDRMELIASGPSCPDPSTAQQVLAIAEKYHLTLSQQAMEQLQKETPKQLENVENQVTGSVGQLCRAAVRACQERGYETVLLTDRLTCEAREAGAFLAAIGQSHQDTPCSIAFVAGGETVVHRQGNGLGGRNQELALAAVEGLADLEQTALFSLGSDGTDGPTDAAGGYVDGTTLQRLRDRGVEVDRALAQNDSYHALQTVDGLLMTGPTGTNVNDVSVLLIRR